LPVSSTASPLASVTLVFALRDVGVGGGGVRDDEREPLVGGQRNRRLRVDGRPLRSRPDASSGFRTLPVSTPPSSPR